jgi:chromosome segregation ATPase
MNTSNHQHNEVSLLNKLSSMDDTGLKMDDLTQSRIHPHRKSNVVEKMVSKGGNQGNNLKNLYQNIGTRVSKLREINESYQIKIKSQKSELDLLDDRIAAKMELLNEIRLHKKNSDVEWFNNKYREMCSKDQIKMRINVNHVQNDPALKKLYHEKETELSTLQNRLNSLIKKTDQTKEEINTLRIENHKHESNLEQIISKKNEQSKEMDKISEEANKYLKEKGNINKELVELNEKIESNKNVYDSKMQELNKMIDNTKKIKEFHETLAIEKFSKNTFRKNAFTSNSGTMTVGNTTSTQQKPTNKISEEEKKLEELNVELKRKKRITVYLNFSRLILLRKQQELQKVIEKVKTQTGIENLDKLSEYLELSTKTNKLFETDLKDLNEQKIQIEEQIEGIKKEIQSAKCVLNDSTTKKFVYLDKLKIDLKNEEELKQKLNKKLFTLNRVIDIVSKGFKDVCLKLNFFDKNLKLDAENNEDTLTKCMDFLERKMIEIIQLNTDPLKEEINLMDNEEMKNIAILEKVQGILIISF